MTQPVKVGVIGCGNISSAYFSHAPVFPLLEVAACADLDRAKAQAQAEKFHIPQVLTVDELLASRKSRSSSTSPSRRPMSLSA